MFIVKDLSGEFPYRNITNDIDTAADIVMGITGDERDYKVVTEVASDMKFDDLLIVKK